MARRKMAMGKGKMKAPTPKATYRKHVGKPQHDRVPGAPKGTKKRLIPKGFI